MNREQHDENILAGLGYRQEFKRDFSGLELAGLSFSLIGVVQTIAVVLLFSLPYAGVVGMVWGWFACCLLIIFVALAMAELASAAPTAGGLYYWTFTLSSPRCRKLMAWLVGYFNTVTFITATASACWGIVTQVMAAVSIGSDGRFVATNAQMYGVFCAVLVSQVIVASLATKVLARLQYLYVLLNFALFLVIIIALPAATPTRLHNPAVFAFGKFENTSGWPDGYAFILSFLAPSWTIAGFDTSVHISEEARNAPYAVPFAILSSTILASILGWIINIVLAFYIGDDLDAVIGNPIGQPMATILFNSVGKNGTLVIWAFIILAFWTSTTNLLATGSRQVFAFSRDRGLPFSSLLYSINPHTQTPVYAVIFLAFMALLLGLLSFAGPLTISAIFTMAVVSQYICFVTPIVTRWVGGQKFVPGPFNLGIMSAPVAFVASAYMLFMIVVFLFPSIPDPDSHSMNYTVVVLGGTLVLSLAYYFFPTYGGRHWFTGPVTTIHDLDSNGDEKRLE
ncbi:amino acid/polyamine transporter I [Roridomyces roridus]|uniref:Amino acid/polyamine transporter I n=1 Tax=Roridomyces roridus TaxID=1738132 RepID=A0AAD7CF66_9AGAR|nr:amino acid/polyamine transporter I [Roridomyces roridus]